MCSKLLLFLDVMLKTLLASEMECVFSRVFIFTLARDSET